ncbi:MAG TPA: thermonuclease family protein [Herpetosiphonaceae bacterium]|nr:thermonuclease family protein [Herpetosiphonaceae bacterium]
MGRIIVALLTLLALVLPVRATAAQDRLCFPGVPGISHCIEGRFRDYWQQNGGLPVFGYPITAAAQQQTAEGLFLTQYFERNRFELHPEQQPPHDVLLGRLGDDRLKQQGRDWQAEPRAHPQETRYFAETGHAIAFEGFWHYWQAHGLDLDGRAGTTRAESLALFGYPITEVTLETNAAGDRVLTQWFERARFEDHGARGVLLGLLGTEVREGSRTPSNLVPEPGPRLPPVRPIPQPADLPSARVVRVIDGDTVDVALQGRTERLRLIGIDTPEVVDPRMPVQCFGREASAKAHELLDGKTVFLEADPSQDERDTYDRLLRYVWLPDGRLFNREVIAQGYAHEYTYRVPYRYQAEFKQAEREARGAGHGLWSPSTCNGNTEQPAPGQNPPPALTTPPRAGCDAAYPTVCIPSPPPDLDCRNIPHRNFRVLPPDPHRFDSDSDGIGCEGR